VLFAIQHTVAEQSSTAPDTPTVSQSLLLEILADNPTFTLVDARSAEEFAASHIAGAINVPHDAADDRLPLLPSDLHEVIIIYCKTDKRAAALQTKLEERGYTDVRVLQSQQIFWFDGVAVFNCGVPASEESADDFISLLNEGNREK